jgi:hypothetical protein
MIASTLAVLALPFALFVQASPFPHVQLRADQPVPIAEYEIACKKFTRHTLSIQGTENSAFSASQTLKVTYDGADVCPEERHECFSGCSFTCESNYIL